jgi:predicted nucleic acid-binding protein
VIAYFDTSALVAVLIDEPASPTARRLWQEASRVVSALLVHAEAHGALAAARRQNRLTAAQFRAARERLDGLLDEMGSLPIDWALVVRAGDLAWSRALRGYDAVHLAAAERLGDDEVLFVSGDRVLCGAARGSGLQVSEL